MNASTLEFSRLVNVCVVDGVMAAGEFTADGTLVDYRANMNMPPEVAAMSAQFCATVSMMFNSLAAAFSHLTPMEWTPQQGWAYSGGDMTVAVGGRVGDPVAGGVQERAEGDGGRIGLLRQRGSGERHGRGARQEQSSHQGCRSDRLRCGEMPR